MTSAHKGATQTQAKQTYTSNNPKVKTGIPSAVFNQTTFAKKTKCRVRQELTPNILLKRF